MKRERPADEIRQLNYAECPHREIALRLNGSYMAIKGYLRNCARDRQKRQYDVFDLAYARPPAAHPGRLAFEHTPLEPVSRPWCAGPRTVQARNCRHVTVTRVPTGTRR